MLIGDDKHLRFDWILDALATRVGIIAILSLLVSVFGGAGYYVHSVVAQLEESHAIFRGRQTRNGYVAMSDIQRLIIVTQRALDQRGMTPALENEFSDAADILYVRTDNFERIMRNEETRLKSGAASIAALHRIVEIADNGRATGFVDVPGLYRDLVAANEVARAHLVQFLDDMRRTAEEVLEAQSLAVRQQQVFVIGSMLGLTAVGVVALFLLRREVIGRRARELAEERVAFLAYFDPLTGLPNRAQFQERLNALLQEQRTLALLFLDLDDFKLINDTHGHAAGDAVLRHIGGILESVAKEFEGHTARLAGDEFALLIPTDNIDLLSRLCDEIIASAAETYWFEGEAFVVGLSIGLATTTQVETTAPTSVDMLSRVADFALYTSKASGRKCYTVYDHIIEKRFWERRALIEELPRAIEQRELEVHLQPKVTLADGAVYGFEALVRWRRNGKLVPPSEFITIAEESGLVVDIDHFVLRESTQLISDWNNKCGSEFSISVNLSALHFSSPRITGLVEAALWNSALPPRLLTLEVTETTELRDWKQARHVIEELKSVGCRIAIDDFGTGFSSLAYLRTMKAHELKIDRSLIFELEESEKARMLLASVLEIARNFELEVTVEGIETEAQADIARRIGADCAQGFLFGRPCPPMKALEDATLSMEKARSASAS